jgi:transposase
MELAQHMSMSAIADLVGEHDTVAWRMFRYWVEKAQVKRDFSEVKQVGMDETSSKKGHNYISHFIDMEDRSVLFATEGKKADVIEKFVEQLPKHNANAEQITDVAMDMSRAFIKGVRDNLPNAQMTFDKFHVIQALNKVMNQVWRSEVKQNPLLKRTRYTWLKNPENLTEAQQKQLKTITKENLKTTKVYQMKLAFQDIYRHADSREVADELIQKWLNWAVRSKIEPVKKFARMLKRQRDGILAYFDSRLTSGAVEGVNSRIQEVKRRAKGFRNTRNFIDMIYLVCGNLELDLPT